MENRGWRRSVSMMHLLALADWCMSKYDSTFSAKLSTATLQMGNHTYQTASYGVKKSSSQMVSATHGSMGALIDSLLLFHLRDTKNGQTKSSLCIYNFRREDEQSC